MVRVRATYQVTVPGQGEVNALALRTGRVAIPAAREPAFPESLTGGWVSCDPKGYRPMTCVCNAGPEVSGSVPWNGKQ